MKKKRKQSWTQKLQESIDGKKRPSASGKSKTRKALEKAYKESYEEIPSDVVCPACGLLGAKERMERHHPAGRSKSAFCFTVMMHSHCHKKTHDQPDWGTENGLLWSGRNSKTLTVEDASSLVELMRGNQSYVIPILTKYQIT